MCSWLGWIIVGGLAGWLASIITGRNQRQGCLMNVVVGVVGAFIGGFIYNLITGGGFDLSFTPVFDITSITGFLVALGGAVVLLVLVNFISRR